MLKTRKRWVSLLTVVVMLAALLIPMVGPASAASTATVTAVPSVSANAGATALGSVYIFENSDQAGSAFPAATLVSATVTILTSGVEFTALPVTGTHVKVLASIPVADNTLVAGDITVAAGASVRTFTANITASQPAGTTRAACNSPSRLQ